MMLNIKTLFVNVEKELLLLEKIRDLNVKNAEIKLMIIKKFLLKFSEN